MKGSFGIEICIGIEIWEMDKREIFRGTYYNPDYLWKMNEELNANTCIRRYFPAYLDFPETSSKPTLDDFPPILSISAPFLSRGIIL
jgi:IS30 family transposase